MATNELFAICIWEDGHWCWADEVHEYTHRSDIYVTTYVADEFEAEQHAVAYAEIAELKRDPHF